MPRNEHETDLTQSSPTPRRRRPPIRLDPSPTAPSKRKATASQKVVKKTGNKRSKRAVNPLLAHTVVGRDTRISEEEDNDKEPYAGSQADDIQDPTDDEGLPTVSQMLQKRRTKLSNTQQSTQIQEDTSDDEHTVPLVLHALVVALDPNGKPFLEDTIEWENGKFSWDQLSRFEFQADQTTTVKTKLLICEYINTYIGNKRRLLQGDQEVAPEDCRTDEAQLQRDVEDWYKERKKGKKADFVIKFRYAINATAVEARDARKRAEKEEEAAQKAEKKRQEEEAATIPRRRQASQQERFARVSTRPITTPSSGTHGTALLNKWACQLGDSCAHSKTGLRMCYYKDRNMPSCHYAIHKEDIDFWNDEIDNEHSTVEKPSRGLEHKLTKGRPSGTIIPKTAPPVTPHFQQQSMPQYTPQLPQPSQPIWIPQLGWVQPVQPPPSLPPTPIFQPTAQPPQIVIQDEGDEVVVKKEKVEIERKEGRDGEILSSPPHGRSASPIAELRQFFEWVIKEFTNEDWKPQRDAFITEAYDFSGLYRDLTPVFWQELGFARGKYIRFIRIMRQWRGRRDAIVLD